jgi:hypothetical protein
MSPLPLNARSHGRRGVSEQQCREFCDTQESAECGGSGFERQGHIREQNTNRKQLLEGWGEDVNTSRRALGRALVLQLEFCPGRLGWASPHPIAPAAGHPTAPMNSTIYVNFTLAQMCPNKGWGLFHTPSDVGAQPGGGGGS